MSAHNDPLITATELRQRLDDGWRGVLLDCRFDLTDADAGARAYAEGHLPGAHHADLNRHLSGPVQPGRTGRHPLPDPADLQQRLRAWGLDATTPLVVYDDANSLFAARAWWLARWAGVRDVRVLDGGWRAWLAGGGETATDRPAAPTPGTLIARCPDDWLIEAPTLADDLNAYTLIDARAPERYSGATEPLDSRAGHIPGAWNAAFAASLDAEGRFLPAEALARRFEPLPDPAGRVCYCGSGVSACHVILAMERAGLPRPRLYAGSWSHWITDDNRPIETGFTREPL